MSQTLYRIPSKGQLGGVAAGLAIRFGIDIAVLRVILFFGLIFSHGIFFCIYLILWATLPVQQTLFTAEWQTTSVDAHNDSTFNETRTNMKKDSNKVWGIILIILGTIFLLDEWIPDFDFGKFWPLILIAVGGYVIFKDKDKIDFDNKDKNNL
jgi:phage shock protein PspC (stress-responsive transcriptional regulator)